MITTTNKQVNHICADRLRNYSVRMQRDLLGEGFETLVEALEGRSGVLISTPTVSALYADVLAQRLADAKLDFPIVTVPLSEANKTMATVEYLAKLVCEAQVDRNGVLIAIGGGVCSDLVTMVAALFRRGIRTLRIPTTLIGQVDAAIGIKAAVNFEGHKSGLGAFYPPNHVLIDPSFLKSLPQVHVVQGLAEIMKMALVRDAGLYDLLDQHREELARDGFACDPKIGDAIIWRAVSLMLEELEPNLYEDQTFERLVDFGHTFSPLIEARSGYRIHHGEAVAVDMAYSCAIAVELGLLDAPSMDEMLRLFAALGLPCDSDLLDLGESALAAAAKHRGGQPNLVVPTAIGAATFVRDLDELDRPTLQRARQRLSNLSAQSPRADQSHPLVFDIGGTSLRAALFDPQSKSLIRSVRMATPSIESQPQADFETLYTGLRRAMLQASKQLCGKVAPQQVGVAFPGPLNDKRKVLAAPTIWDNLQQKPLNLLADLQKLWPQAEIALHNDVAAAGFRYRQKQDFCIVTVSSGIGNKVFIEGVPYTGVRGRGGEIGHLRVDFAANAPRCDCGGRGHLAAHASGRGTLRAAREHAERHPASFATSSLCQATKNKVGNLTNELLAEAYRAGDDWSREVVHGQARYLAHALAQQHQCLGLEAFVLIGGFALALGEPYRAFLAEEAAKASFMAESDWQHWITLGQPDDDAGLIGMGLALQY